MCVSLLLGCIPMRRMASVASARPEMFAGSLLGPTITSWSAKSIRGQFPCLKNRMFVRGRRRARGGVQEVADVSSDIRATVSQQQLKLQYPCEVEGTYGSARTHASGGITPQAADRQWNKSNRTLERKASPIRAHAPGHDEAAGRGAPVVLFVWQGHTSKRNETGGWRQRK